MFLLKGNASACLQVPVQLNLGVDWEIKQISVSRKLEVFILKFCKHCLF